MQRRAQRWAALHYGTRLLIATAASGAMTAAGGMLDVWVYMAHGHVFATAQTGNVVLLGIALANGDAAGAWQPVPSLVAFVAGLLLSRVSGTLLKRRGLNSRTIRLGVECALLVALGAWADRLSNDVVTACVGFLAALQITTLSHIGSWSFNTGMTTGNLRGAMSALSKALFDPLSPENWLHAAVLGLLCAAFAGGAIAGGCLTPRWRGWTLLAVAAAVLAAALVSASAPDPLSIDSPEEDRAAGRSAGGDHRGGPGQGGSAGRDGLRQERPEGW